MTADRLAQALKLIATASPSEHAFEYVRGIAREALRYSQSPAEGDAVAQTGPSVPVDVSAFKDWTTRQKLGYVHQNLRWAACGYVHTPERIEGLRICWKLITDILESPDESQAQPKHTAPASGGLQGSNVNPDAPTVRPPVPPAPVQRRYSVVYQGASEMVHLNVVGVYADNAATVLTVNIPSPAPGDDDKALTQALEERDAASDYIDALLDEVLGKDRHEWTSNYGHADAMAEVRERMAALQATAVGAEPAGWAVYWGLPPDRKHSIHFEWATAEAAASQIKSCTRIEPVFAAAFKPPVQHTAAPEPIRCPERLKNGGTCPHHNLQCGWPACNKEKA